MLFTPAFLFLFPAIDPAFPRLTPNQAIAMGLIVEFVGYTSSSSAYCYRRMVAFDVARQLLLVTVPVAVAFSFISFTVPPRWLLVAFGGILFLLAGIMVWQRRARAAPGGEAAASPDDTGEAMRRHVSREGHVFAYRFRAGGLDRAVSAVAGAFGGLTGIGAGPIVTTILHARHHLPLHLTTATSIFVVAVTVLSAAASHALLSLQRNVALPWALVGTMAVAVLLGGQIAARVARWVPERFMRRALIGMFLFVGVLMLVRALGM